MPRKKRSTAETVSTVPVEAIQPQAMSAEEAPVAAPEQPDAEPQKNWGPPYKALFTCGPKGFEMGENRRYKQRVFIFQEKPDGDVLEALKDAGFQYRAEEKAWTIRADAETRKLSDNLARKFAGIAEGQSLSDQGNSPSR